MVRFLSCFVSIVPENGVSAYAAAVLFFPVILPQAGLFFNQKIVAATQESHRQILSTFSSEYSISAEKRRRASALYASSAATRRTA